MTRSVTGWFRIEPLSDSIPAGPGRALQARVYDPAWLLGRQWQLGEMNGEDAASPASVRLRLAGAPLTRVQRGPGGAPVRLLGLDDVLEPVVEAEPAGLSADWAAAVAAGNHFLAAMEGDRLDDLIAAFRAEYPVVDPDPGGSDPAAAAHFRVVARRGIDGAALAAAVGGAGGAAHLPDRPTVDPARRDRLLLVVQRWLDWYPPAPPATDNAWVPERLEYRFAVAGPSPSSDGEVVLEAPAYQGGRLDWHDLSAAPSSIGPSRTLGAAADEGRDRWVHASLPTRVTYPGMPANRWWEFEDGEVSYGHIEAEGGDVARLLLIEFATVYGNDWFLAPYDVRFGSVVAVDALVVTDTFGQATLVRPASSPGWRMFEVTGAPPGLLVMPAVAPTGLEGPPIEAVQLARDEAANLAWAIERTVTGPSGTRVDRHEQWRDRLAAEGQPAVPAGLDQETLVYQLAVDPPDHWIPLVPRSAGHRAIRLERGTAVHGDGRSFPPQGRLLEPDRPLALFDEELPRSGLLVTRSWQVIRTANGDTAAWIARRTRPGRGESHAGVAFDRLRGQEP